MFLQKNYRQLSGILQFVMVKGTTQKGAEGLK